MLTKPPVPYDQEKALVGAFSVITNLRMELFEALAAAPVCGDVTTEARNPLIDGQLSQLGQ